MTCRKCKGKSRGRNVVLVFRKGRRKVGNKQLEKKARGGSELLVSPLSFRLLFHPSPTFLSYLNTHAQNQIRPTRENGLNDEKDKILRDGWQGGGEGQTTQGGEKEKENTKMVEVTAACVQGSTPSASPEMASPAAALGFSPFSSSSFFFFFCHA